MIIGIESVQMARRRDFGKFLRERRTHLQPSEVGLPDGGRRHVRGLRRSEVAEIAEIGVSWYSMLEQGRVDNVSARMLDAIAKALRFKRAERDHLAELAAEAFAPPHADLSPPPQTLLDFVRDVDFGMAFIVAPSFEVVAYNLQADAFFTFSKHGTDPNLLRLMLTDAAMRDRFVEPAYENVLTQMVGHFRLSYGRYGGATFTNLIAELHAYGDFARIWDTCALTSPPSERTRIRMADGSPIDAAVMAFTSFAAPAYTIILKITRDGAPLAKSRPRSDSIDAGDAQRVVRKRCDELGAFLRSKRETMQPADVGLTPVGRRHARGLRRDEVAERAGIGVSRYTMLEQGRIGTLPPRTLVAIADALLLSARERTYLTRLAASCTARFAVEDPSPDSDLIAFVRSYPDGLAHFHDADFNMVAWNAEAGRFYGYDDVEAPNLLEIMAHRSSLRDGFVSPSWQSALHDMLAHYRFTHASLIADGREQLLARLAESSPAFARVYAQDRSVANPAIARSRFHLPTYGIRDADVILLTPASCPSHIVVLKRLIAS
jgi:transcriptional regulator with XRE-family HTH domain